MRLLFDAENIGQVYYRACAELEALKDLWAKIAVSKKYSHMAMIPLLHVIDHR